MRLTNPLKNFTAAKISPSGPPAPLERQNAERNLRAQTERPPLVRQNGDSNLPRLRPRSSGSGAPDATDSTQRMANRFTFGSAQPEALRGPIKSSKHDTTAAQPMLQETTPQRRMRKLTTAPYPEQTTVASADRTHAEVVATAAASRQVRQARQGIDPQPSNLPTIREE